MLTNMARMSGSAARSIEPTSTSPAYAVIAFAPPKARSTEKASKSTMPMDELRAYIVHEK